MASVANTKNRLSSTKTTQKVIKAMELVASSKIKKARDNAQNVNFYFETTLQMINEIYSFKDINNFLNLDNTGKDLVIVFSSDMGLCGAYNANIIKKTLNIVDSNTEVIAIGSKIISKMNYESHSMISEYKNYSSFSDEEISLKITNDVITFLKNNKTRSVKIVYTKFINALVQEADVIDLFKFEENKMKHNLTLLIEPDRQTVFTELIFQFIYSLVYSSLLHSVASEHSYRRNAMESANKNSLELIDKLNLELNRIRQAMITQEISEIIGGSEALKKG